MAATKYTDCITFTGESSNFTLAIGSGGAKEWDGTVEYSTDHNTWTVWNGTAVSSVDKKLYLRGSGNTKFFTSKGTHLSLSERAVCSGNIQTLLEYSNPPTSIPAMFCYRYMFYGCTSLTKAPDLPATTLATACYTHMFSGCTNLTTAPKLPATTLASACYQYMFNGCTSLTTAPDLPATTLADYCYANMFYGCTSLKISATQSSEYSTAWRIPSTGTASAAKNWNADMLTDTGGTFAGTPGINKTYYGAWTSQETDNSKKLTKLKYKASDFCQLFDKDKFFATRTIGGVTFTNNGDGSLTINCTADDNTIGADNPLFLPPTGYSQTFDLYSIEGHKYLLIPLPQSFSYSTLAFIFGSVVSSNGVPYAEIYTPYYRFYTATKTGTYPCYAIYRVKKGATINNVTFKPQLFDLTEMYGAGNEPTTLAEFRQKYPNELYLYSPQCWYSINKTRYMSNQYGNSVLPDDIFVDYVKSKQFFYIAGWSGYNLYKRVASNVIPKIGLLDYKAVSNGDLYGFISNDKTVSLGYPGMYDNFIMVRDLSFNGNTEKFKQFIIGNNVWFELETPTQGGYLPLNKGVKL